MNTSHLKIGIIHSLIGKNDGVSIVIDQTVNAMVEYMGIDLGNIFFLAAHSSPRFNATTNEIFWHKNHIHKIILENYSCTPKKNLDELIHKNALYAKKLIKEFVEENDIDLIIAHNTSHPYNFITAVGLGYYMEELHKQGIIWPKVLTWWHDSYLERERFKKPNKVISKYLQYLPGIYVDGIAFLNSIQPDLAKKVFRKYKHPKTALFFTERTTVVPNTCEIEWDWEDKEWDEDKLVYPPQEDGYNNSFFKDVGIINAIRKQGFTIKDTIILLQHTRVVPRKNIELAIDFAFMLENKFAANNQRKCITILISGHSGDEQIEYKNHLKRYYREKLNNNKKANVLLIFGENTILSHRDIIVDKKYYKFKEIPAIVAKAGGIGTYFSEVEGYGNNLLEMISMGLPVVINEYEIYKSDIEQLGFKLPSIDGELSDKIVTEAYNLISDIKKRNYIVKHNLQILKDKLDHKIIAEKLNPLIEKIFKQQLK